MRVAREIGQRDDIGTLIERAVARAGKEAARKAAFKVKPPTLVTGNQSHRDTATALQVGDHTAIHAADGLEVGA